MPWKTEDVEGHIKGLDPKQKEVWVSVANKALARCQEGGGSTERCEGSAIRQANAVAKNVGESMTPDTVQGLLFDFLDAQEPAVAESTDYELQGDLVPLIEKAIRTDGTVRIKLIEPGWGSSGFYSSDILKRDGPKAFPADTQMFFNHQTEAEERERPEGDVTNLVGKLMTAAQYDASGPAGPGLYADAKVFRHYKEVVEEIAPDIGVSIRAMGKAEPGEAEDRTGMIINEITYGKSVDYVTAAGAGGKVVELFEAARNRNKEDERSTVVDEKEAQVLRDANEALTAENATLKIDLARLQEAALLMETKAVATDTLAAIEMPDIMRSRLVEQLAAKPVLKEGALDCDAFVAEVKKAAAAEIEYMTKATGGGHIKGMGDTASRDDDGDTGGLAEAFEGLFRGQGNSTAESKELAALAAEGR